LIGQSLGARPSLGVPRLSVSLDDKIVVAGYSAAGKDFASRWSASARTRCWTRRSTSTGSAFVSVGTRFRLYGDGVAIQRDGNILVTALSNSTAPRGGADIREWEVP
jgi:hypothetical protein